ncbi:heterokaryon incompatibility protein, partial [Colletotrichum sojae]
MSNPCSRCAKLSIESLLDLARIDFTAHTFSKEAFFKHHKSFDDLEDAAREGCDLCRLVLESFQRAPCPDEDPWEWPDEWIEDTEFRPEDRSGTMYSIAKGLQVSDIKLCLNATHLYSGQGFEDAQVFDEILV